MALSNGRFWEVPISCSRLAYWAIVPLPILRRFLAWVPLPYYFHLVISQISPALGPFRQYMLQPFRHYVLLIRFSSLWVVIRFFQQRLGVGCVLWNVRVATYVACCVNAARACAGFSSVATSVAAKKSFVEVRIMMRFLLGVWIFDFVRRFHLLTFAFLF